MVHLARVVPAAQVAVVVPVADLVLHQIVRPAGTEPQTTKNRQEKNAYPPEVNPFAILDRIMQIRKISTLLVVQKEKLVGLITEFDIFGMIEPIALRLCMRVVCRMSRHQEDRKLCVVRISGAKTQYMLNDLWKSGHTVLDLLHMS